MRPRSAAILRSNSAGRLAHRANRGYIRAVRAATITTWPPERAEEAIDRPSRLEDQAPLRASSRRAGQQPSYRSRGYSAGLPDFPAVALGLAGPMARTFGTPSNQPACAPLWRLHGHWHRYRAVARRLRRPARRVLRSGRRPAGRLRHQGDGRRHREGHGRHRRRPEDRGPRCGQGIPGPRPGQRNQDRRHRRSLSGARRERARRGGAVARQGAARGELGQARDARSRTTRRSPASSSTRSRAASPSTSTARWRSCRARRSTSGRSATSPR